MKPQYVMSLTLFLAGVAMAGSPNPYEKAEFSEGGRKLPYRVLKPVKIEQGKKYPLVIFLHGAGERGTDNQAQLIHGSTLFTKKDNREKHPCFVLFPQCPSDKRWVEVNWSEKEPHKTPAEPSEPMALLRKLLDQFLKENPVNTDRIYVMGLSMGGFGTWDFAARYPDLVAAIAPICGGADLSTAGKIKHIAVWAFHGGADTVVWPQRSRLMVEALKKAGTEARYSEYAKVGHGSWNNAFAEPELLTWMFAQKRK